MLHSAWTIVPQQQGAEQFCWLTQPGGLQSEEGKSLGKRSWEFDEARPVKQGLLAVMGPCLALGYLDCTCPAIKPHFPPDCTSQVESVADSSTPTRWPLVDKPAGLQPSPRGSLMPLKTQPAPSVTSLAELQSCSGFVRLSPQLTRSLCVQSCAPRACV
jgi:hypothetical protein